MLPVSVAAALVVVLSSRQQRKPRETLALIFWSDAAPADALHPLRVNLYRAKQLLEVWGQTQALQVERTRLRLALPTDIAPLHAVPFAPGQWLQGRRAPGYDGFAQWCDDTAAALQRGWLTTRAAQPAAASAEPSPAAGGGAPPGRRAEHQRLLASPSPALLLLGEPGAGKTTLLRGVWPHAPCLRGLEAQRHQQVHAAADHFTQPCERLCGQGLAQAAGGQHLRQHQLRHAQRLRAGLQQGRGHDSAAPRPGIRRAAAAAARGAPALRPRSRRWPDRGPSTARAARPRRPRRRGPRW